MVSAGAIARLLIACAVLAGLFAMHGLPAQGCAAGSGVHATAMSMTTTERGAEAVAPAVSQGDRTAAHPGTQGDRTAGGVACVFTPASRGIDALLVFLLLAATVALAWPAPLPGFAGRGHPRSHRAPPRTGARLLTTLCVSRT
ncbi:DUF6153 family protein [Amycolatopsis cynarae]|uniref:DUF6153 family protein n=1 Tax=Amycolatopsis cynarae TaxID=2995223 RepID=A0ABY7BGF8_9PSEU|nr:DUF6153 family protein [Amycolatopsis sp. HUAS 11-8]WAL69683.1 DUF6153 family protein [Amycolatopsis sp. HUAS 11-8]